jgi:hypothetical protein
LVLIIELSKAPLFESFVVAAAAELSAFANCTATATEG